MTKILPLLAFSSLLLSACTASPSSKTTNAPIAGDQKTPVAQETPQANNKNQNFSGPLKAALALGVPLKCTNTVDGTTVTGYIKNGLYYSEYEIMGQKETMLVRDNCSYIWQNEATTGVKFCAKNVPGSTAGNEALLDSPDASTPKGDINCLPSAVDDALFVIPTNVTFSDMSQFSQGNIPDVKNVPGMKDIQIPTVPADN
jgi:hypothetical protein